MTSKELIEHSLSIAEQNKSIVEAKFLRLPADQLNRKPDPNSWSAAECFQHLLFTNGTYLKNFQELAGTKNSFSFNHSSMHPFKHSFWGKFILYFVNPKTKIKSKTTKSFNPSFSQVEPGVVQKYLSMQAQLIDVISNIKGLDLMRLKMPSPINQKIKYNIGDAIKILVLHDQRHIQQAERALAIKHNRTQI